jgi:dephospho-CoA kinase
MPFTIGLTGGIATGKSTVSRLFQDRGIEVIDADEIVRHLISHDRAIITAILEHFGPRYRLNDGSLDRKSLRSRIFSNPGDKAFLEDLLHPRVRMELEHRKKKISSTYGILVIPLLIEAHMMDLVDRILVVDLPLEQQIRRIMNRDHIDQEQAELAISNQLPAKERLRHADDVIENTVTIEELAHAVESLHQQYLQYARAD